MKHIYRLTLLTIILILMSCAPQSQPTPAPVSTIQAATDTPAPTQAGMPNPASVFCEEGGYKLEIRTAADGSQSGYCIFPDGSECDEWAYFRGECGPSLLGVSPTALT